MDKSNAELKEDHYLLVERNCSARVVLRSLRPDKKSLKTNILFALQASLKF